MSGNLNTLLKVAKFLYQNSLVVTTNLCLSINYQLGTPQRHLFTSGLNEFAKEKSLTIGDSFVFLRYINFGM